MNNFGILFCSALLRARKLLVLALVVSLGVMAVSIIAASSGQAGELPEWASIKLGFIDRDGSPVTKDMASYLEDELRMGLVTTKGADELNRDLLDKRISGVAEIPKGFQDALLAGRPKPVELTFTDDYANEAFVKGNFGTYMESVSVLSAAAGGDAGAFEKMLDETDRTQPTVERARKDAKTDRRESEQESYRFMLGFFMMFSFMMSIIIPQMLHVDRLDGTFRRIRASNVTPVEYIASIACIGFIISLLIEGPAMVVWHMTGTYSGVPLGVTVLMLFAFAVLLNSLGIFLGIAVKSFSGITTVIVAGSTITSMLSGAWFPLEMVPPIFLTLSKFTPQRWVYEAIYSYDKGDGAIGVPLAVLLLASLTFLVLAGIRFADRKAGDQALAR
ncbi:MAG: ABC transporter permease [Clostridiales Family XIII bacterium]|nr:ABC transporter permease [Clostridiales Family XIII bacterium]